MLWRLQTMADSATQLSDEVKGRHKDVDWRGIRGFRNIVVHGYVNALDLELTWTFVEREVGSLSKVVASELSGGIQGS
jgi:uncharacterized protein with HEPN domain